MHYLLEALRCSLAGHIDERPIKRVMMSSLRNLKEYYVYITILYQPSRARACMIQCVKCAYLAWQKGFTVTVISCTDTINSNNFLLCFLKHGRQCILTVRHRNVSSRQLACLVQSSYSPSAFIVLVRYCIVYRELLQVWSKRQIHQHFKFSEISLWFCSADWILFRNFAVDTGKVKPISANLQASGRWSLCLISSGRAFPSKRRPA